jgi:hypothetical protein
VVVVGEMFWPYHSAELESDLFNEFSAVQRVRP